MLPPGPSPLQRSHPRLPPTYKRSVFEGRFELLRPAVWGTPLYRYKLQIFLFRFIFLITSKFSDQLLLRKRFLRKKVIGKRFFLSHNLRVFGHTSRRKKTITFFLIHKIDHIFGPPPQKTHLGHFRSRFMVRVIIWQRFCFGMVSTTSLSLSM